MGHADTTNAWTDHAAQSLSAAGYRRGGARTAVVELFAEQGCALSALEVEELLGKTDRRVGRASVYRILEELERLRLVTRVDVGDGVARFETVDPGGHHHHHLLCEDCGRLVPFSDDELERVIGRVARRLSFEVGEHDITLRGACEHCRAS